MQQELNQKFGARDERSQSVSSRTKESAGGKGRPAGGKERVAHEHIAQERASGGHERRGQERVAPKAHDRGSGHHAEAKKTGTDKNPSTELLHPGHRGVHVEKSPRRETIPEVEPTCRSSLGWRWGEDKAVSDHVTSERRPRTKSESRSKLDDRTMDSDSKQVISLLMHPKRRPIEVDAREFRVLTEKMLQEQKRIETDVNLLTEHRPDKSEIKSQPEVLVTPVSDRREPERRELERRESERREPERLTPDRREHERLTPDWRDPERLTERRESDRLTPDRRDMDRREPERLTPDRREPERLTPDRREPERLTPEMREPERLTPDRREPDRLTPDRREPERREHERITPERREPERREPEEKPKNGRKSRRERYEMETKSRQKRTSPEKFRASSRQDCISIEDEEEGRERTSSSYAALRSEKDWLKEKLLEEFDKVEHKSHKSKSSDTIKPAKVASHKGKDQHRSRRKEKKEEAYTCHHSPVRTNERHESFLDVTGPDTGSRKPSRSSMTQETGPDTGSDGGGGLDSYAKRSIPPQPTGVAGKLPPKSDRRKDWPDSPMTELHSAYPESVHASCNGLDHHHERGSTPHSLASGGLKRGLDSPPARNSTIPRERSVHHHRHHTERTATIPRGSSPQRSRHADSTLSMPCSPPPYVHPKLTDKDCGCPCDCRSSFYASQEVGNLIDLNIL